MKVFKKPKYRIRYVGERYSSFLFNFNSNEERILSLGLPNLQNIIQLKNLLGISIPEIRFIAYHEKLSSVDHYHRYSIPKRNGGVRHLAAPKPLVKKAQHAILEKILMKINIPEVAHGFIQGRSILTNAKKHLYKPEIIIKMDIEDFFPSISFERVRGMFHSFGYSGFISTLLAMICTDANRIPFQQGGKKYFLATSERHLPQGSPASPMISNIICIKMDKRLKGLAKTFNFRYTRYADDLTFSTDEELSNIGTFCAFVKRIVREEGFQINKRKTRFLRQNAQQNITGIVVNEGELCFPRNWIRNLRAAIHNLKMDLNNKNNITTERIREIQGMLACRNFFYVGNMITKTTTQKLFSFFIRTIQT